VITSHAVALHRYNHRFLTSFHRIIPVAQARQVPSVARICRKGGVQSYMKVFVAHKATMNNTLNSVAFPCSQSRFCLPSVKELEIESLQAVLLTTIDRWNAGLLSWEAAVKLGPDFDSRPSDHYFRSACLFICLCRVFLSRLWSAFDQTRTHVICMGL